MKQAKKKKRTNAGPFSFRKTKKAMRKRGHPIKSSKRRKRLMKHSAASKAAARLLAYGNPKRKRNRHPRKLDKRAYGSPNRKSYRAMKSSGYGSAKTAHYARQHTARSRARYENRQLKTNRWYKGPRGTQYRIVRGKKGRLVVQAR